MKLFETDVCDDGEGGVIKLVLGMGIKSNAIRRTWLMLTLPIMLAANFFTAIVFGVPYLVMWILRWLFAAQAATLRSTMKRWNEPRA